MIPGGSRLTTQALTTNSPSKTYRLDDKTGRIVGLIDGLDAIVQAAYKILRTERFAYEIYSQYYGVELVGLMGQDKTYVHTVLVSRLLDALMSDQRIISMEDFLVQDYDSESLLCTFTLVTVQGDASMEWRV